SHQPWLTIEDGKEVPLQYESVVWIDMTTKQIDSVVYYNITKNAWNSFYHYIIKGYNNINMQPMVDSVFNFENPDYSEYSRHTEFFPPYSKMLTDNEIINDSILSFSFISLHGDSVKLNQVNDWILLDYWRFGCSACFHEFEKYNKVDDSSGRCLLDKESIRMVAANIYSDNLELIGEMASKYNYEDIFYGAKGIALLLKPFNKVTPSYFLISPDKQIVWRSNDLGDYSELLKAKADYEKQHQKE
ncbi:MAG: hypothetical protein Q4A15_13205, partial [Prevotellaceae bacterium]|nr:hypothetical protein [Prevotellaceae bacterium]